MNSGNESEKPKYKHPLKAKFVKSAKAPDKDGELKTAKYFDVPGDGPYLRVTPTGYKYWEVHLTVNGRRRTRGMGPYPALSLKEAREQALAGCGKSG